MRPLLLGLIALATSTSAFASDLQLIRVWPGYRTADSFMRISEYFTGLENPGKNETLLRTHPDQRAGFYFLTRTNNHGAVVPDARFEVHVITPESTKELVYAFNASVPSGQHVFEVGLTGKDWEKPAEQPVAWRMVILAADGHELASEQSFLWSTPERR